jgi:hypothetical protein
MEPSAMNGILVVTVVSAISSRKKRSGSRSRVGFRRDRVVGGVLQLEPDPAVVDHADVVG